MFKKSFINIHLMHADIKNYFNYLTFKSLNLKRKKIAN